MTPTADLFKVTTYADSGAEIPRFTNFQAVIPLAENRRYVSSGGQVSVRIEAEDEDTFWDDCQASNVWESLVPHRHVSDDADQILATATDALAREGFRVAGGWTCDGGDNWAAPIEPMPEMPRCRCGSSANRVFTPLDPTTGEPDEESTFYRCSVHAYDSDVPQENIRQRQICWRGVDFGSEPRCMELIEYVEGKISGWYHVNRSLTRSHHAVPKNR